MKRTILLCLFGALGTICNNAWAQSFTVDKDTNTSVVPNDNKINFTNVSSSTITLKWNIVATNLPQSWQLSGFGICDNNLCWNYDTTSSEWIKPRTSKDVAPNTKMELKLQIADNNLPNGGPYFVTVNVNNGSDNIPVTYLVSKFPTGISTIRRSEDITIYPNPAHNELNVLFDGNAGIKNISVYNLIGKVVSVYRVSGNSAKLELSNIPSGIYFVRLVDNVGNVVATRKFTRQ